MSDPAPGDAGGSDGSQHQPPLRSEPRPWGVHWFVDSAVAFLVVVIPLVFLGGPVWFAIVVGLVLGLPLSRWTRRLEAHGLEARRRALGSGEGAA